MDSRERIHRSLRWIEERLDEYADGPAENARVDSAGTAGEAPDERVDPAGAAAEACLSPFHFHRVFVSLLGEPPGAYIRGRRLTRAARELVDTDRPILEIALRWGWESQAGFTRRFTERFGRSPGVFRRDDSRIPFVVREAYSPDWVEHRLKGITMEPRIETKGPIRVVGLQGISTLANNTIPALWEAFNERAEEVPHRREDGAAYGICQYVDAPEFDENTPFTELAGIEVTAFGDVPVGMVARYVPARKYAIFTHKGPVGRLRETYDYIYGVWLSRSGEELEKSDDMEVYDERFSMTDPENSELDIWVPLK